jgi:colicin import membrane protein
MTPLLALLAAAAASAPAPVFSPAELAAQRAAIEQRFERERQACEARFAVTPCLDEVRERRQAALQPLVRQEQALAAEQRLARAAAQRQRVSERELAAAQDEGQRRQRLIADAPPRSASSAASAVLASPVIRARDPQAAEQRQRLAASQAEAQAAERRERAQERQQRVRERVAAQQSQQDTRAKPAAAPLPRPGASAASL